MGTLLGVKQNVEYPSSLLSGPSGQNENQEGTGSSEQMNPDTRPTQVSVPQMLEEDYIPTRRREHLILNIGTEDFIITDECQLKIKDIDRKTLAIMCSKAHGCKKPLYYQLKQFGEKPEEKTLFFHLRMIHQVSP